MVGRGRCWKRRLPSLPSHAHWVDMLDDQVIGVLGTSFFTSLAPFPRERGGWTNHARILISRGRSTAMTGLQGLAE